MGFYLWKEFTITYNGQKEKWYYLNSHLAWWEAFSACKSIGKSAQPIDVLIARWKLLGVYASLSWSNTIAAHEAGRYIFVHLQNYGRYVPGVLPSYPILCR